MLIVNYWYRYVNLLPICAEIDFKVTYVRYKKRRGKMQD
jgi:hypothetical protein